MSSEQVKCVGAIEAKGQLSKLLKKVEAGDELTITKRGTPIARLVPVVKLDVKTYTRSERRAAIDQIKRLSERLSQDARR